ncbi:papain-like cysteine protease family protein [Roseomonas sp. CAU 1739]|uniref:papain-like cysteine protease family protein n=1 Tax=Roseomonas sp. CAU 1739 TaxID=3140364 RepID=UPI00325A7D8C
MASIYLDVPFVTQLGYGDATDPMNDRLGCWYAAACMVGYYFEQGPRLGLPDKYGERGHSVMMNEEVPELMENEGLVAEPLPADRNWTGDVLLDLLRKYGPLSFGWMKTSTRTGKRYGHRSVLIGYDTDTDVASFHDPERQPNQTVTLADFNARFRWVNPYAMLRRDGTGLYTRAG